MRLKLIVKSFVLAGLLSSSALTPLFAQEAPKGATASTRQSNNALYNQLPSLITPISRMPIKALLLIYLKR